MSGRRPGAHDLEAAAPCRTRASARLTWIGHATVLLELGGMRLLTDPVLRGRLSYLERQVPGVDAAGYDGIDAALVSHLHFDHLDLPSLELLGRGAPLIVPRGGGSLLRRRGFRRVTEVEAGEEVRVGPLTVGAVHAEHPGARSPLESLFGTPFGARTPALGYVVAGGLRVYFAGDTGPFDGMAAIGSPRLDVALLPVGGWGPFAPLWERLPVPVPGHLDPRRAAGSGRRPCGCARPPPYGAPARRAAPRRRRRPSRRRTRGWR